MTTDLAAIRARDANCYPLPPIVDESYLRQAERDRHNLLAYVDALAVAARKVTCGNCANDHWGVPRGPCPDCADLRAILEGEK